MDAGIFLLQLVIANYYYNLLNINYNVIRQF